MLLLRPEFFLWGAVSLLAVVALLIAELLGYIDVIVFALAVAVILVATLWRWGRYFLTYMTVDPFINNGNGRVSVERIIPAPNLPEQVEMSLQDAAEGVAEVNTIGVLNTIITILRPFRFLRALSIGDLTLRTKSGAAKLTMYNIQDPEGVKNRIQAYWKEISKKQAAKKAIEEEEAFIRRMTVAVAQGLRWAQDDEFQKYWLSKDGTPEPPKTVPYRSPLPAPPPAPEEGKVAQPKPAEEPPPTPPPANGSSHPT